MNELKGHWTDKDIDVYLKTHPNKIIVVEKRIFISDING